jgi:hypothetical protein
MAEKALGFLIGRIIIRRKLGENKSRFEGRAMQGIKDNVEHIKPVIRPAV